ncbi:MAG: hypothetical protein PF436_10085 [Prolixibacteraceae bacterium]|jgi:hypothetical protein|nr:hypothetical protein [Prolixibacteraceae bacterium]
MEKWELNDRLFEATQLCSIHNERMTFAHTKIKNHFPLNINNYSNLKPEELSFFDQLIFRFSKMQDSMGSKLFPAILENLGEEAKGIPFIDQLSKLEELNIIPNANDWILLRETRNIVTHEYPFITDEVIQGLNLLNEHFFLLTEIWGKVKEFITTRYGYNSQ